MNRIIYLGGNPNRPQDIFELCRRVPGPSEHENDGAGPIQTKRPNPNSTVWIGPSRTVWIGPSCLFGLAPPLCLDCPPPPFVWIGVFGLDWPHVGGGGVGASQGMISSLHRRLSRQRRRLSLYIKKTPLCENGRGLGTIAP